MQKSPNGHLDLWAREHYKSTIITYAKTIQDILASHGDEPLSQWHGIEPTFGIFSHTRPIAKGFLRQIKREFEGNDTLKSLFPDVCYENPSKEAPKWSEDDGLVLKRKSNPKESTIEAWGLVDGQPTSKHFFVRIYDDVVSQGAVTTPEMIAKVTSAWELSTNLASHGGYERYIGTRYHYSDTYATMLKRKVATPRIYPGTDDGTASGNPIFLSQELLDKKRREMGPYVFACQILQDPKQDASQGFSSKWLRYYTEVRKEEFNLYIFVDPANEKKKRSDYTAAWCIGLGMDNNYYAIDVCRDRLNLSERTDLVFEWHRKYKPLAVFYEKYGMQSDIEHIRGEMERANYRFTIQELGGNLSKVDRIRRLVPIFENQRMWLPVRLHHTTYEGKSEDMIEHFKEEYMGFPVTLYDDMLDSLSRIQDENISLRWPGKRRRPKPNELPQMVKVI